MEEIEREEKELENEIKQEFVKAGVDPEEAIQRELDGALEEKNLQVINSYLNFKKKAFLFLPFHHLKVNFYLFYLKSNFKFFFRFKQVVNSQNELLDEEKEIVEIATETAKKANEKAKKEEEELKKKEEEV